MAKVGSFGKVLVFSTNDKKILTFNNFSQKVSARWTNHERIGKKPKSEFLGPDLREVSFEIELNAMLGVKPRKQLEKLEKAIENGTVANLVIGGKKVGKNKWKIVSLSEKWNYVMSKGEVVQAIGQITMEEYV
ncbi:phage tail protein [Anaerosporobacter faecicola]|uniref:phage tail protein n=1 Tax=Anaerosporobacter faecicola TaxID=2718714 RepID=UPI0014388938|nr:phage tail protein [Anaerosporobacter faecicola]